MKNFAAILAALVLTCACNAALEENYNKQETIQSHYLAAELVWLETHLDVQI